MVSYIITQKQINEIFRLMRLRHLFKVKELLRKLPEQEFKGGEK